MNMTVNFTIAALLIPYALVVIFVGVFAFFNIHHLVHYGATTRLSYAVTMTFLIGVTCILFLTWQQLGGVNWSQAMSLTPSLSGFSLPDAPNPSQP